ncbi:hypothetical protein [Bacteroides ovatus]|jgi:hypothetical protein|uniref:hypothetical protein n=1 Tax=Bacteroides ovatus TaxID=28116 RepID=UPI0020A8067C|nr:hypothetical protein [Bacteroides ovatus]CAG9926636.1 hypothetical protein BOVAC16_4406 [Bacteroides ovatus]
MGDDNIKTKILDIQVRYEDAIRGIAKYQQVIDQTKDKQKELRKELDSGQVTIDEYNMEMEASKLVIAENKEAIRILEKEIQNNIKAEKQQQDSLVALRASLSNLTRQYDEMSEAERNSASGEDLEIHINAITDKIKDAEEKTQRFYRNVGSYQQAFEKALSPLKKQLDEMRNAYLAMSEEERKGAAGEEMRIHMANIQAQLESTAEAGGKFQNELLSLVGIQGGFLGSIANSVGGMESMSQAFMAGKAAVSAFGKQLLALLMNPIVAIIAGIALVIMGLVKAINSSEEATNRVSVLLAPLKKMLDGLLHLLQIFAAGILTVAEAWAKLYDWQMRLMEKLPLVGEIIKEINESNREAIELAKEKIAIEQQSRTDEVQNAKDALEVSKLRTLAKDKEKYTAEERLKFVREANKLEEQQADRNVKLAERKLKALQTESEWAENNAETNKELAKLEADVYRARKEQYDKTRELKEQENTIIQEGIASAKAEAEAKKKAAEESAKTAKEQRDKERDAIRQTEDALLSLIKDEREKRRKEINLSYSREIIDLKRKLAEEKNLTSKAKDAIIQTIKLKEQQLQVELQKLSEEQLQKDIANRQKLIDIQLAAVKSGSEQEYQLKMQQLMTQRDMELSNTELTEQMKLAIKAKYDKQMDDLVTQREADTLKKQQDAVKVRFETEIAQAHGNEEEILRIKVEQKRVELDSLHQMEGESIEAFNLRKVEIENAYLDAKQDLTDKQVEIEQVKFQATADITNSLSALADAAGEHSKELAMASKILALAEIAINTGKAIAAGVAQAQSVPFPGNIAAIATTIATVIANITTAIKTVKSAKFASGGQVVGPGTGTSDSVPAQLSNGESVITARATSMFSPILSSFNMMGGGVPINLTASSNQTMGEDMLARAVAKGVQMMPRPVVSVEEINSVSNRVEVLENLGNL